ncbi:amino acid adenylation domain-containing protein [Streptomyces sp. NBC_00536]|uniref:amino acid adenylation domain-containing protein n=1 Tax=Streptomyces sp. NBC_00536 TaxID=2975769 RepID=UPI002E8161F4|nr:amino acid adenylation domain-containing protein [Streptomyces sp. NBC_00536]WUC83271.1 amino acid adenylation domain-containing protein [Streptomyces sp. NBC_00536]
MDRLPELLHARAAAHPDSAALRQGGRSLTSRELLAEVVDRAAGLSRLGYPPATPVAVGVGRDIDSVLTVMALLEAGYVYVPVDAGWPAARREFVLADVGAAAVVDPGTGRVTELPGTRGPGLSPSTAYVLYTSGSTGRPKGVAVSHDNVLSLLRAATAPFRFEASDVWTVFHSLCFDFSVWELWAPLYTGACAVLVDRRDTRSPAGLRDLVLRERVSVLNLVPSVFHRFMDACAARQWPRLPLRQVVLGGEAIDRQQCLRWIRHQPQVPLVNMYGITEATVHTTYKRLTEGDLTGHGPGTPIGRPLDTWAVRLVDGAGAAVAPGAVGEIAISGAGVALGYVANPEENRRRFVELDVDGSRARFFRTGDLARAEGPELFYAGRADAQLKVNGHRIESGEIETALREHPGVRACAALDTVGPNGVPQLAALVVADGRAVTPAELRTHLLDRVPTYMIPGIFVFVDALPISENGKLDRTACRHVLDGAR